MMKSIGILTFSLLMMIGMTEGQTHLWSMTTARGTYNFGTIFKIKLDGSNFQTVYSFDSLNGKNPYGKLLRANNGKLYGMTILGGLHNDGVIFSFDPLTGNYVDLFDFDGINGSLPYGGLIQATDGKLYGLTSGGNDGSNFGTLFNFDITTNTFTKLVDFISSNGRSPYGSLIQSNNGKLYGIAALGGDSTSCSTGCGALFSYDIFANIFTDMYKFNVNNNEGTYSFGSLIEASNGKLYGMTSLGGIPQQKGVIFSFDTSSNIYTNIINFHDTLGERPHGSLLQASNGLLFGLARSGGVNNFGTIFSVDSSNNQFTKLLDFDSTNGSFPYYSLIQASNGNLYGMTLEGGTYDKGVIFSFDITNNANTVLLNFNGITGSLPEADFIEIPDSLTNGINSIPNKKAISVYPNPATTNLTIHQSSPSTNQQLIITDVLGNEVYHQPLNQSTNSTINISQLSDGVYFYELRNESGEQRGKFVKE